MNAIDDFLALVETRLAAGEQQYGNQSFVRPVAATCNELEQELADLPGWLYVLWCQAARKLDMTKDQKTLRPTFLENLRRRLHRNDRGKRTDSPTIGLYTCLDDIECLAMDAFAFREEFMRRLQPIARAIEVAQVIHQEPYRGRRGGVRDPRSDD